MDSKYLNKDEVPDWFKYPSEYMRIVDQNLIDFNPWIILQDDQLRTRYRGIKVRYPKRELIPFARREDNDDVACWERNFPCKVFVVHDFASPGYENKEEFNNFWDWLRRVIENMIDYDA